MPEAPRRVLVTGASGLLGGAVAQLLRAKGHRVRTFQRRASAHGADEVRGSLTDPAAVRRAVAGVDAVIHLAAKVSFTGSWHDFVATNITGTTTLLAEARDAGVRDFVFVSSPSVAHFGEPLAGAGAGVADPDRARGNYARSKAAAELLALAQDSPDFRVASIRPHVVWGPGDTQLVERVIERAAGGRLPLLDGGAALIDTTYIDNAAGAIVRGLERMEYAHGRALVVTNGEPRPVGELMAGICRAGGVPAPRISVPGWLARGAGSVIERVWLAAGARNLVHDEPPMTRFLAEQLSTAHWFDQRETREVLDWKPEVGIDEGLARLAAHYGGIPSRKSS
ncbi:NAD-dependent epimerase/dehydratase family protein [Paeniglutamicibacter sp. ABSL32-1]|uniref:NAD-dependent epimerase/dehydratase family protein n=1 Tax=Paeniglutamicibacter quisquiliarum TaxID=2849498 RepID=UPI001C2DC150|nr:NAD-dependent epimerase/dehydratase family protein [Paeniglutamicibacter quisquiliarum]MBV1780801.1 NAD-dependent epimerase/dehydratase family protein [Paeniglutamicibacter quisquiliarum]